MGSLQSSSHSVFFTPLLKAEEHVHGDMALVCETFLLSVYINEILDSIIYWNNNQLHIYRVDARLYR